jgi:hypothetical protein
MVITLLPTAALADDTLGSSDSGGTIGGVGLTTVAYIGDSPYVNMAPAISAVTKGGTIKLSANNTWSSATVIAAEKDFTIDLNGYTITATATIVNNGTLTITDSSTEKTGAISVADANAIENNGTLTVESGTISSGAYAIYTSGDDSTVSITDGTFTGTTAALAKGDTGSITVSGGTFSSDPSDYLASGYTSVAATKDGVTTYTVELLTADNAVAVVGTAPYKTVQAAITAANSGDTVTLMQSITEDVVIPEGKDIVLNLNGKTLTGATSGADGNVIVNGTLTLEDLVGGGKVTGHNTVDVYGTFNMKSGAIESNNYGVWLNTGSGATATIDGGTITAQEFCVSVRGGTTLTINDGTLTSKDNIVVGGNGSVGEDGYTITMNGGKLVGQIQSSGYVACGIYHPNDGTVTINGGEIETTGGVGVLIRGGTFKMTDGTITVSGTTTTGMVGDAKEIVGCYGVEVDSTANYPKVASAKVTISGGTIDATNGIGAVFDDNETKVLSITGGTYSSDPTGYYDTATYGVKDNGDGTYTVLPLATITKDPTPVENLIYNGKEQTLVEDGTYTNGTMVYSFEENGEFTSTIPAKTDADTYTIYYKVDGGDDYIDTEVKSLTATIAVKSVVKPAEDTTTFTYDGTEKTYTVAASDDYTVTGNTATDAGPHTVTIALNDTKNTKWSDDSTDDVTYTFTIGKAATEIKMDESYILNEGDTCDPNTLGISVTSNGTPIEGVEITVEYYTDATCEQNGTDKAPTKAGTYYAKVTSYSNNNYAAGDPVIAKITIVGTEEEAVAVDPVVNYDEKLSDDAKAAVKTSVESVKITDTDKLTEAVPDVDPDPDEVKAAIEELDSGDAAVTVYTEAYLDIQAKEYTVTDTTKTLTLDITPKYQVVVSTATDAAAISTSETAQVGDPKKLTVVGDVEITITLPTGFAAAGQKVYITHETSKGDYLYETEATEDGKITFTNPDGFSSFTFSTTAPEVLIKRQGESTHVYRNLIAAINEVEDGETISYTGASDVETPVNKAVSFTIDGEANIVAGDGYVLATTNNGDGTTTYTVTAKPAATGGTSSGVSTYAVSVANAEGGKVTASASKASKGTKVTLTVTAEDGKELDALTVTDASGKTLETTKNADGTYTFTMPASKVTVTATFKDAETQEPEPAEEDCPAEKFTDVDTSKWYHEAVDYVLTKGVMEGNSDGTFTPNGTLTRAQLAQILYNAAGKPEVTAENPFTDVPETHWYAKAVIWAAQAGVVEGYGDGKFGPNDKISRQDLAVMLWRYAGEPAATQTALDFTDAAQASDYATAALLWASETGIVQGDNGKLSPKGSATRAEAATMVMRYLELG